jgi:diacylglycerol kinase family enzyme
MADAPMNLIGVANGLYAGGGMMLSPDARADDGKLDVVTASGLSRTNVVTSYHEYIEVVTWVIRK